MLKVEAEKLVGSRVEAWTAMNGIYTGTLVGIKSTKPWRGIVEIDSILQPACVYEYNHTARKGFRVGERIEVGGVNIIPTDKKGFTEYLDALKSELNKCKQDLATIKENEYLVVKHLNTHLHIISELEKVVKKEM